MARRLRQKRRDRSRNTPGVLPLLWLIAEAKWMWTVRSVGRPQVRIIRSRD